MVCQPCMQCERNPLPDGRQQFVVGTDVVVGTDAGPGRRMGLTTPLPLVGMRLLTRPTPDWTQSLTRREGHRCPSMLLTARRLGLTHGTDLTHGGRVMAGAPGKRQPTGT